MPLLVPPAISPGSLTKDPQPVLETERDLVLRPWTTRDAPALVDAFSDPAIQYWHGRSIETIAEAEELVGDYLAGWQADRSATWAIASADGEVLGRAALREFYLGDGEAEVAYFVRPSARGRGAAVAGVRALTAWAFAHGFHRLFLNHSTANEPSCRVADKSGFVLEGTKRSAHLHIDGWHDMHLHALINPAHTSANDGFNSLTR